MTTHRIQMSEEAPSSNSTRSFLKFDIEISALAIFMKHELLAHLTRFAAALAILPLSLSAADGPTPPAKAKSKAASPSHRFGRAAALEDVKRLEVAKGLEATLFACEPDLVNPCDMDIDARGRIWVTEGANYRSSFQKWGILRPEGDRIVILEDTDGDETPFSLKIGR